VRWSQHETTLRRQEFFDSIAPSLVSNTIGSLPAWAGPRKLSGQFAFRGNDDVLAIVSWPSATQVSADEALAWGMAYGGDRDVALFLPETLARPTLQRLPWIAAPIRVFTFANEIPTVATQAITPARFEVLEAFRGWRQRGTLGVTALAGAEADWVHDLTSWIRNQPGVAERHRQSYYAWHFAGRQVLSIKRVSGGLSIEAGTRYSKPSADQPVPHEPLQIAQPLTSSELEMLKAAILEAIARRESDSDAANEEHRLQHALHRRFEDEGSLIGLTKVEREYPAWRPVESPAYIDFLGAAGNGVPHVVETKLDNDVMLALQGLDYWIWATANPNLLTEVLGTPASAMPAVDFVVGAFKTSKVVGTYTLRQLEAFDGSIPWRFHVVRNWRGDLTVETLPPRRVPDPPVGWKPAIPPRFAQRLQKRLITSQVKLVNGSFYDPPNAGILPRARLEWAALEARERLHKHSHHVRSSQAFALNMFAGLDDLGRRQLADLVGIADAQTTTELEFEFEDEADRLREATTASPHRTQTDVAMRCTDSKGHRTLLLVEVKLSELDFGHCSAYETQHNDQRSTCRTAGPFGNDATNCFQLRNHDHGDRRTYELQLQPASLPSGDFGCTFRLGANQPMRNVALGRALMLAGEADEVIHALAAPRANIPMWRRWGEAKVALAGVPNVRLADLPAELLLSLRSQADAAELTARYDLHP